MSAHGPATRHSFVHEDAPPIYDRLDLDSDQAWQELNLAALIRRTPIRPQPHTYRRNRNERV